MMATSSPRHAGRCCSARRAHVACHESRTAVAAATAGPSASASASVYVARAGDMPAMSGMSGFARASAAARVASACACVALACAVTAAAIAASALSLPPSSAAMRSWAADSSAVSVLRAASIAAMRHLST